MSLLPRFDTPASLRDLPADSVFYDNWHNFVSNQIATSTPGAGGVGEFYNPSTLDVNVVGERLLTWMAFPRRILMPNRDDRNRAFVIAEDRDVQDEYCEWRVIKNADGKITKITFVTETPEYWEQLWAVDPGRVVELYRELVGDPSVSQAELEDGSGGYKRRNRWNEREGATDTHGIVHLIQSINNLGAALGLVQGSAASGVFNDNYEEISLPNTSVDPRVELDVSTLVRKNLSVTLRDPVGLYIVGWDDTGWSKPNGTPVGNYWRIVRGRPGQVLRLEYEVSAGAGFVVGDIRIGGRRIEWGGQVAEHVTVTTVGTAGVRASAAPVGTHAAARGKNEEEIETRRRSKVDQEKVYQRRYGRQITAQ
jgi:hypothetical protein